MNAPEHLHHLVSDLGDSLVQALTADTHCREIASQIQARGYALVLILEAAPVPSVMPPSPSDPPKTHAAPPFSEDDRRLMKSFKISMD